MRIDINKYRFDLDQFDKILHKTTTIQTPKGYKVINARTNKEKNKSVKK